MAKKSRGRKRLKPTDKKRVSAKISKVKRDDPGLTNKQALGKAFGILRHQKKKGKR